MWVMLDLMLVLILVIILGLGLIFGILVLVIYILGFLGKFFVESMEWVNVGIYEGLCFIGVNIF